MTQLKQILTAALSVAMLFTLSCSGGDDTPADNPGGGNVAGPIKKAKISGVFQKGPFIAGTAATLNELDNDLNPTGRPYQTLLTDDKGSFELRNVELVSPYAHLIATGFYRNEVTGRQSSAPITLQAIVDVTNKDNINVNILTHLEYYRVIDLVDGGMTVKAAKKQALKEIFAVFGIDSDAFNKDSEDMSVFGTSDADGALLAISILLLGSCFNEADFTQRLMNLSTAIRAGGGWNDEAAKKAMAEWAGGALLGKIRNNILSWGLSSTVPDFEKFVSNYWVRHYCSENNCFTDPRDGTTYRTVTVDGVTFMIDGLIYRGENGSLGKVYCGPATECDWEKSTCFGVPCVDVSYNQNEAQNICPVGWHLPKESDVPAYCYIVANNIVYPGDTWGDDDIWQYNFGYEGMDGCMFKWGSITRPSSSTELTSYVLCVKN